MYLLYSILLALGFLLITPLFLLRREKYASGFSQRLGNYPEFKHDERKVIWLHCVSVGETNAARPLVDALRKEFPNHRLVVSTTTKTGQELARKIFLDKADAVIYFPFDFKFAVRRALEHFKPSLVLLMETEIWPRFIHEAKVSGAGVAIVNGRLSQKSFNRYTMVRSFVARVLADVNMAIMQDKADAQRIIDLGIDKGLVFVSGNLKFKQTGDEAEDELSEQLRARFGITRDKPLIVAASTHEPEERYVLEALEDYLGHSCRLLIAPRHPERFDVVEKLLRESKYSYVRRTQPPSDEDSADIILLDTIGELRSTYRLAEIVFVGGSMIPHGGQSVIEPAAAGKAIITGPHTHNFASVVQAFEEGEAILKIKDQTGLTNALKMLLTVKDLRVSLGNNALVVVMESNKDAGPRTVKLLRRVTEG